MVLYLVWGGWQGKFGIVDVRNEGGKLVTSLVVGLHVGPIGSRRILVDC